MPKVNWDREHSRRGTDGVHVLPGVELQCGHHTTSAPVYIRPSNRKTYRCPDGCGLQKPK